MKNNFKMISAIVAFVALTCQAFAENSSWQELTEKIAKTGEINSTIMGEIRSRSFKTEEGGKSVTQYISVLGKKDDKGLFSVQRTSFVTESSQILENGNIQMEQVLRYVDGEGDLTKVNRRIFSFTSDMKAPLSAKEISNLGAEEEVFQYLALLESWKSELKK